MRVRPETTWVPQRSWTGSLHCPRFQGLPDSHSSGLYYKHVTIVNDKSSIVNKWCFKLIDHVRVVSYDRNRFIMQATAYFASSSVTKKKKFYTIDLRRKLRNRSWSWNHSSLPRGNRSRRWGLLRKRWWSFTPQIYYCVSAIDHIVLATVSTSDSCGFSGDSVRFESEIAHSQIGRVNNKEQRETHTHKFD